MSFPRHPVIPEVKGVLGMGFGVQIASQEVFGYLGLLLVFNFGIDKNDKTPMKQKMNKANTSSRTKNTFLTPKTWDDMECVFKLYSLWNVEARCSQNFRMHSHRWKKTPDSFWRVDLSMPGHENPQ